MTDFPYSESDRKRIWALVKIVEGDGCWEWQGACSPNGYGKTEIWKNAVRTAKTAHKAIYEMHLNELIPRTTFICHKCDNKKCCRPDHLFLGTARENILDCVAKGRHKEKNKTHCVNGHEYTPENTRIDKRGHRACKTCIKDSQRRSWINRSKKENSDSKN